MVGNVTFLHNILVWLGFYDGMPFVLMSAILIYTGRDQQIYQFHRNV